MHVTYNFVSIGVWNIQGLFTFVNKVKLCKLDDPAFKMRLSIFDILVLQEIQCGPSDTQALIAHGFRILPFHRKKSSNNRYFGGTLILIKNRIRNGIKIIHNLDGDKIWIKLEKKK